MIVSRLLASRSLSAAGWFSQLLDLPAWLFCAPVNLAMKHSMLGQISQPASGNCEKVSWKTQIHTHTYIYRDRPRVVTRGKERVREIARVGYVFFLFSFAPHLRDLELNSSVYSSPTRSYTMQCSVPIWNLFSFHICAWRWCQRLHLNRKSFRIWIEFIYYLWSVYFYCACHMIIMMMMMIMMLLLEIVAGSWLLLLALDFWHGECYACQKWENF